MTVSAIFITTSIPYVNGAPHVGFAWELVLADVLARFHRARGRHTWLLTGTDDNSLKNVRAAEAAGQSVAAFVQARGERFAELCGALGISHDDFVRTAFDRRHAPAVQALWRACDARGDIFRASYRARYCVGCEQFFSAREAPLGRCPEHDQALEEVAESNHFFRLSAHRRHLEHLLAGGGLRVWPEVHAAEARGWISAGLEDFSISRATERARGWGVAVPGDPEQIAYVWFDALTNYLTGAGYCSAPAVFQELWQGSSRRIHVIGKNVTRFHCIYWPAILESAGLKAPSDVVVHGFLTDHGRKIGKSLGNGVDPFELVARFGAERLRFHLLRGFPLGRDGDFSTAALTRASNTELSDQLGNLLSRVAALIEQNTGGQLPEAASSGGGLEAAARGALAQATAELERCDPHAALDSVIELVRACNLELARTEPWRLARRAEAATGSERSALRGQLERALGDAARGLLWAGALLEPFLPGTARRLALTLGAELPPVYLAAPTWSRLAAGCRVQRGAVLFERLTA